MDIPLYLETATYVITPFAVPPTLSKGEGIETQEWLERENGRKIWDQQLCCYGKNFADYFNCYLSANEPEKH